MLTPQQLFEIHGYYDKDRFILIDNYYSVVCPHLEPNGIANFTSNEPIKSPNSNNTNIHLKEYRFKTGEVTLTGKCSVCGKVYYR